MAADIESTLVLKVDHTEFDPLLKRMEAAAATLGAAGFSLEDVRRVVREEIAAQLPDILQRQKFGDSKGAA